MLSCVSISQSIKTKEIQLAQLAKHGQGHSIQAQVLLDEVAALELDYRNQGCWVPPPPPPGHVTTIFKSPSVSIPAGGQGDFVMEIECTNNGGVDTTVEYSIDPPVAGLTSINSWTADLPSGHSVQELRLTVAVADDASNGPKRFYITENAFFGPVRDLPHQQYDSIDPAGSVTIGPNPAYAEIAAKAADLGVGFTGGALEPVVRLDGPSPADSGAYRRRFSGCTIYYSPTTGAHEIHGDIRAKYDLRYQSSPLIGIPVGDQSGCPDGRGYYNHFSNGASIYSHPDTGPFVLYGAIRALWAQEGWEAGPLGYPTRDQYVPNPNEPSNREPISGLFQNGSLYQDGSVASRAKVKAESADEVRADIWNRFNDLIPSQQVRVNVGPAIVVGQPGLAAATSTDAVTDTAYGFEAARNRIMTVTINGFVSLNWGLPDPTFRAHLSLLVYEDRDPEDGLSYVYVALTGLHVVADGLYSQTVATGVSDAISRALRAPAQVRSTILVPPALFGLVVTSAGGVEVYHA